MAAIKAQRMLAIEEKEMKGKLSRSSGFLMKNSSFFMFGPLLISYGNGQTFIKKELNFSYRNRIFFIFWLIIFSFSIILRIIKEKTSIR